MKRIFLAAVVVSSLVLTACGSRPDNTNSTGGDTTTDGTGDLTDTGDGTDTGAEQNVTIRAVSDRNVIQTGGTDVAKITALITNMDNQALSEQPVNFSSTGGVLQNMESATDENGQATAELRLAGDHQNQDIRVTVASGLTTSDVLISASGTSINFAGPTSLVLGDSAELTMTLTAGNDEPIGNETVAFLSDAGNQITPSSGVTDVDGRIVIEVNSANGDDQISAFALNNTAVGIHDIDVAQDILSFVTPAADAELAVGSNHTVTVQWTSQNNPVANENLRFGITAGQINGNSLVTTDGNGRASVVVSSTSAGLATISVAAENPGADGSNPATQMNIEFIATQPASLLVDSSNSRVPTGETSTITALVSDANGNPVKNVEVEFYSTDLKGGQINPASTITDSNGEASVTFTAGSLATEYNSLEISARVIGESIDDSTYLTVVERKVNITLGTSGLLDIIANEAQYGMPFAVQVADGGGAPLQGADVDISITPTEYSKGYYVLDVDINNNPYWRREVTVVCASEDLNGNRILDPGEDVNNNGVLDPQDPAVIAAHQEFVPTVEGGVVTTDANGTGYFTVLYPASNARWSRINVVAFGQALGVEAEELFHTTLYVLADRVNDTSSVPPNFNSPYGVGNSCADEL